MKVHKIAVMGMWHLGAVTSACLAETGHQVVGIDLDSQRVDALQHGIPPLHEPGLEDLIKKNQRAGRLKFTDDVAEGLKEKGYVIATFDTPVDENDDVDLSLLHDAIKMAIPHLEDDCLIIISSQVPIGSCEAFRSIISDGRPRLRFSIACVPENLCLGQAIERFMNPDLLVIGANESKVHQRVENLYRAINAPRMRVNIRTAEMIKHAINAYMGLQISFINEIGDLCDKLGVDGVKVGEAMRLDRRIGPRAPLNPGLGFAGGTLARDLKVLHKLGNKLGHEMLLVSSVLRINRERNRILFSRIREICGPMMGLTVGILGLTYKPDTSTLRRSASLELIRTLEDDGAKVQAYDPKADLDELDDSFSFKVSQDPLSAARGADALIFMTPWPEFLNLDMRPIRLAMRRPIVIDGQNMLNSEKLVSMGFTYIGIGRGSTPIGSVGEITPIGGTRT